ncbi:unnamed protein product [Blepharisma stoltei]|uniref:Plant heme peroxidase family profile domain-containing protein n=1 Tax=Blepharisma stoltei TaxID=1481888 RepID=A0AAU9IAQ6_9CILI|nr:unnamed protein product [Blepharisma stoltei]
MLKTALRNFGTLTSKKPVYKKLQTRFNKLYDETTAMPLFLRLAWHDAGTFDAATKTGGPNGSIRFDKELAHGANAGLTWARDQIVIIKADFPDVNYADLIQAGGYIAVEYCKGPAIAFKFGRKEAPDDSHCTPDGRLPDAKLGADHLRSVFGRMGFNDKEIVALSGAHTLGLAHKDRSGFEGEWTTNSNTFDNAYFTELLKPQPNPKLLRLPTDVCLLHDKKMRKWVDKFAFDSADFFKEYAKAHKKLSELGN